MAGTSGAREHPLLIAFVTGILGLLGGGTAGVVVQHYLDSCRNAIQITSPTDGTHTNGSSVDVTGTACGLSSGETGWLFDYDPANQTYTEDYNLDVGRRPVAIDDGEWAFTDQDVGDPGDQDKTYSLVIVRASPACAKMLNQTDTIKVFPSGCTISDTRDVIVSR